MKIDIAAHLTEIGGRIREVRIAKALKQNEFCALGGVNKNSQMAYENGKIAAKIDYFLKLAQHDIDIVYLIFGQTMDGQLSTLDTQFITLFRTLDDNKKIPAIMMLEGLTGVAISRFDLESDVKRHSLHERPIDFKTRTPKEDK